MFARKLTVVVFAVALSASAADAAEWFVDAVQTQANPSGDSWPDSFRYVQDALAAASPGDTIKVAQGWYFADDTAAAPGSGDRTASFVMKPLIMLEGGYRGIIDPDNPHPNADDRDIALYETILSGDLDEDDDPDDLEHATRAENSLVVVRGGTTTMPVNQAATMDGFTIRDGHRDDSADEGAGIYVPRGSNPTLSNLIITRNRVGNSESGGGLHIHSDFEEPERLVAVSRCRFIDNKAGAGGGAALTISADATFEFCEFESNTARGLGAGGLLLYNESMAELRDCVFLNNTFERTGGIPEGAGGLLAFKVCTVTMRRVRFESNRSVAARGGGTVITEFSNLDFATDCQWIGNTSEMDEGGFGGQGGGVVIDHEEVGGAARFFNCLFRGNEATDADFFSSHGGGMVIEGPSAVALTNTLFFDQAAFLGAALFSRDAAPVLVNCTITENAAGTSGGGFTQSIRRMLLFSATRSFGTIRPTA